MSSSVPVDLSRRSIHTWVGTFRISPFCLFGLLGPAATGSLSHTEGSLEVVHEGPASASPNPWQRRRPSFPRAPSTTKSGYHGRTAPSPRHGPASNVAEVSKQSQLIRRRDAPAVADKPQVKESGVRFPQEQKPRGELRSVSTHHLLAGLGTRTADRVKTMNCGMYGRAAVPSRVYSSNA
eukprot:COSAG02_NODE_583_length_20010_cov_4.434584_4_plen_180_part_00